MEEDLRLRLEQLHINLQVTHKRRNEDIYVLNAQEMEDLCLFFDDFLYD